MAPAWKTLTTGAKIRRAHTLLWWALAFPIVLVVLAYTAASNYANARAILVDHSIAQATVTLDEDAPPSKNLVHFKYTFAVDGKNYTGTFSKLNSHADEVELGSVIPVAYANFDPSKTQRPELLEKNADLQSNAISFVTMAALSALLIGAFYSILAWMIRKQTAHLV